MADGESVVQQSEENAARVASEEASAAGGKTCLELYKEKGYTTMHFKVVRAMIFSNTEEIGLMDPYVKFEFEGQTDKTATVDEGGKLVSWNEEVTFSVAEVADFEKKDLVVTVMDADVMFDDMVGCRTFTVEELMLKEGQQTYEIHFAGKVAAKLTLWCYMK